MTVEIGEASVSRSKTGGGTVAASAFLMLGWPVFRAASTRADSTACRAMIPRDVGPAFHGMPGQHSTASRAG